MPAHSRRASAGTGLTAADLADLTGALLKGDGARPIFGSASLKDALPTSVAVYCGFPGEMERLAGSHAGAVFAHTDELLEQPGLTVLHHDDPVQAFGLAAEALRQHTIRPEPHCHHSAIVAEDAEVDDDVFLGPGVVIGSRARIGRGATLHANCWVGAGVGIGEGALLWPNVVIYPWVTIGAGTEIHGGAAIGTDAHGYELDEINGFERLPHQGNVEIGSCVEIGANACIGRGLERSTHIGDGSKIGDLVTIGHDCVLGKKVRVIHQTGLASNITVGNGAVLMGQVGVRSGVHIGKGAVVFAKSSVFGDVPEGGQYWGHPARPHREALKAVAQSALVPDLKDRINNLEKRLDAIIAQTDAPGSSDG